jgi:cytochrome c-type biogenesis protein CcmH/NrfG
MGALLGLAASSRGAVKWKSMAGLAAVLMLGLAGSTVFWPRVNLTPYAELEVEQAGLDALNRHDVPRAIRWLETSTRMRQAPARAWYNLGIAYQRQHRFDDALAAYEQAVQLPDADSDMRKGAQEMKDFIIWRRGNSWLEPGSETNAAPVVPGAQTNR